MNKPQQYFLTILLTATVLVALAAFTGKKEYVFEGKVFKYNSKKSYPAATIQLFSKLLKDPVTITSDIHGYFQYVYKTDSVNQVVTFLVFEGIDNCDPIKYKIKLDTINEGVNKLKDFHLCAQLAQR